jgi:signal peptidase I
MNDLLHLLRTEFHVDFAVILAGLTVVTGVVWVLDKWWLGPRRRAALPAGSVDKPHMLTDFCRSFFPVILLVLLLRSFLAEPFRIPSGSMRPTLLEGDFILVNKFAYGLRDPVLHFKFFGVGAPTRGDVVVFRYPLDPTKDFIKRVIGLPGDRIVYRNKVLTVNGEVMAQSSDGLSPSSGSRPGVQYRFMEEIGAVHHHILVDQARPAEDIEVTVPAGHYFMMGDNRDGSDDSRRWGMVPERNLVGRAFFIWMSWPHLSRVGDSIR